MTDCIESVCACVCVCVCYYAGQRHRMRSTSSAAKFREFTIFSATKIAIAPLAQWLEQWSYEPWVATSSPARNISVCKMDVQSTDRILKTSPHWEFNPGPSVYKTDILPLSYRGLGFQAPPGSLFGFYFHARAHNEYQIPPQALGDQFS